jgi:hypothetical protein
MLKTVIQAIPTYVMSCFRLLAGICDKMRSVISNHWWGVEDGKKEDALAFMGMAYHTKEHGRDGISRYGTF